MNDVKTFLGITESLMPGRPMAACQMACFRHHHLNAGLWIPGFGCLKEPGPLMLEVGINHECSWYDEDEVVLRGC